MTLCPADALPPLPFGWPVIAKPADQAAYARCDFPGRRKVYLVQDAKMPGKNITIYEARPNLGGCLEAFGSAEDGYLSTGAREPEPYFQCMGITASSEFS